MTDNKLTNSDIIKQTKKKRKLQTSISEPYSENNPSETTEIYWIYAKNTKVKYPKDTEYSGKWLVFVSNEKVDVVWRSIKKSTEEGLLGSHSKVATAKPNPNARTLKDKVICVYTYDCNDTKDVMRIRNELRKIGIVQKIPYKTNKATLENKYSAKGDKKISTYYE